MSLADEIKRLNASDVTIASATFLSVMASGFLTLQLFRPDLIATLDTLKLLIFSTALTFPFVAINFCSMAAGYAWLAAIPEGRPVSAGDRKDGLMIAMALTFFVLYASLLTAYLLEFRFKNFLLMVAVLQIVVVVLVGLYWFLARRSKT